MSASIGKSKTSNIIKLEKCSNYTDNLGCHGNPIHSQFFVFCCTQSQWTLLSTNVCNMYGARQLNVSQKMLLRQKIWSKSYFWRKHNLMKNSWNKNWVGSDGLSTCIAIKYHAASSVYKKLERNDIKFSNSNSPHLAIIYLTWCRQNKWGADLCRGSCIYETKVY